MADLISQMQSFVTVHYWAGEAMLKSDSHLTKKFVLFASLKAL